MTTLLLSYLIFGTSIVYFVTERKENKCQCTAHKTTNVTIIYVLKCIPNDIQAPGDIDKDLLCQKDYLAIDLFKYNVADRIPLMNFISISELWTCKMSVHCNLRSKIFIAIFFIL